jgi:hypothetical protein
MRLFGFEVITIQTILSEKVYSDITEYLDY